jgi:hypothetical protein
MTSPSSCCPGVIRVDLVLFYQAQPCIRAFTQSGKKGCMLYGPPHGFCSGCDVLQWFTRQIYRLNQSTSPGNNGRELAVITRQQMQLADPF